MNHLHRVFSCVPSMALILLVQVQSRVFTAKCSEPQAGVSNDMGRGSGVAKFLSLRTLAGLTQFIKRKAAIFRLHTMNRIFGGILSAFGILVFLRLFL